MRARGDVVMHGWLVKMEGIAEWFLLRHRPLHCSTSPIFKVAHVGHVVNVLDARRPNTRSLWRIETCRGWDDYSQITQNIDIRIF